MQDRRHRIGGGVALERAQAGQHLEQHDAEGPDVGAPVRHLTARLFGAHVGGRAENPAHGGRIRGDLGARIGRLDPGQAEIEHFHQAIGRDRDVRGLEIPMHDALLMRRVERGGNLSRDGQGVVERQRAARDQVLPQRDARNELEDEAGEVVSLFEAEERRDVGMVERGQDAGFPLRAPTAFRISCELGGQELDGHVATEPGVARPIDLTHAAFAEERPQDIGPELRSFAAAGGHPPREALHALAEQRSVLLGQQRFHLAL